jgi:hypothetical protein
VRRIDTATGTPFGISGDGVFAANKEAEKALGSRLLADSGRTTAVLCGESYVQIYTNPWLGSPRLALFGSAPSAYSATRP